MDTKRSTALPIIKANVQIGTNIMPDEYLPYQCLNREGYIHKTVSRGVKEYVRGDVHTNTIEGFWSQLKRSVNGTFHAVSPKYLQQYVNEFSWRYNNRFIAEPIFNLLLLRAGKTV